MRFITSESIVSYKCYLVEEEKSVATIEKYAHDISVFAEWLSGTEITKSAILDYKHHLMNKYTTTSVNTAISSLNSFFGFMSWSDLKVKTIKVQKQLFTNREKELTKVEYEHLLNVAKAHNYKLYLLMPCICSTGIRVSELKYITVESLYNGRAEINNKGKCRITFLPGKLCKTLKKYASKQKISSGAVFVSKNGNPLDRSNI